MKPQRPAYDRIDLPAEIHHYIIELEAEVERLSKLDDYLAPTISDNVILKRQVDTLIHTLSRLVLDDFRHVGEVNA